MNDVVTEKERILFENAKNIIKKYLNECFSNSRFDLSRKEIDSIKEKLLSNLETVKLNDKYDASMKEDYSAVYSTDSHTITLSSKNKELKDNDFLILNTFIHELFHSMSRKPIKRASFKYYILEEGFAYTFSSMVMKNYLDSINYPFIYQYQSISSPSDIVKTCLLLEKDKDMELLFRYMVDDIDYVKERIEKLLNKKIYDSITDHNYVYSEESVNYIEKLCFYELEKKRESIDLTGKKVYIDYNKIVNSLLLSNQVDCFLKVEEKHFPSGAPYGSFCRISKIYEEEENYFVSSRFLELTKRFLEKCDIERLESLCTNVVDFKQLIEKSDILNMALDSYLDKNLTEDNMELQDCPRIIEFINKYVIKYFGYDPTYLRKLKGIYLLIDTLDPKELSKLAYADVLVKYFNPSIFSDYIGNLDSKLEDEDRRMTVEDLEEFKSHFGDLFNYEFKVHDKKELNDPSSSIALLKLVDLWCRTCESGSFYDIKKVWPDIFEVYDGKVLEYANEETKVRENINPIKI